jgi:hypothetical protein
MLNMETLSQTQMLRAEAALSIDPPHAETWLGVDRSVWATGSLLAALLIALYLRIGVKLVQDWVNIPD